MKFHQDHVTDLSLHPISDYMLTTSKDKSWLFSDINTGKFSFFGSEIAVVEN